MRRHRRQHRSGPGFHVALASAGADVFVPSLADDDGTTRSLVEAHGRRYEFHRGRTSPRAGVPAQVVARCIELSAAVDILVNSAGICLIADVVRVRPRQVGSDGVRQPHRGLRAGPRSQPGDDRAQGPARSSTSLRCSPSSAVGSPRRTPPPRPASSGFTRAYCDELAETTIQVNAIAPGYFATAHHRRRRERTRTASQRMLEHIPAGRWGDPADLMGAIVFLAQSASDYVNGQSSSSTAATSSAEPPPALRPIHSIPKGTTMVASRSALSRTRSSRRSPTSSVPDQVDTDERGCEWPASTASRSTLPCTASSTAVPGGDRLPAHRG